MAVQTIIKNTVNLDEPVVKKILRDTLGSQDNQAHRFEVQVTQGGANVSLEGAEIQGYFIRAGGETVIISGGVENGAAYVVLSDSCYAVPGRFSFAMKIQLGGVRHTVLWYEGSVGQTTTDSIVDPENVVPSLADLLAQIEAAEQAAERANTAADSAEQAAVDAGKVAYLEVVANTLPSGSDATANYQDGVLNIGIPKGEKGDKGDTGSATPITVNGIAAVDSDITLTASDVGAMPADQPIPSPLDAYPVGSLYWSSNATSPASIFGGTWTQIKDKFILTVGSTYANGATGGAATHTLTVSQMPSHRHMFYIDLTKTVNVPAYNMYFKTTAFSISDTAVARANENGMTNTGSGQAHNNMPPYIAKYCWERTA